MWLSIDCAYITRMWAWQSTHLTLAPHSSSAMHSTDTCWLTTVERSPYHITHQIIVSIFRLTWVFTHFMRSVFMSAKNKMEGRKKSPLSYPPAFTLNTIKFHFGDLDKSVCVIKIEWITFFLVLPSSWWLIFRWRVVAAAAALSNVYLCRAKHIKNVWHTSPKTSENSKKSS